MCKFIKQMFETKKYLTEEVIDDINSVANEIRKLAHGKTNCTLYITDNYFTKNMKTDNAYLTAVTSMLVIASEIDNIEIYSKKYTPISSFNDDFNELQTRLSSTRLTVNHTDFANGHGRYYIIEEKGFLINNSLNGIMAGKDAVLKKMTKKEVKKIKAHYGI